MFISVKENVELNRLLFDTKILVKNDFLQGFLVLRMRKLSNVLAQFFANLHRSLYVSCISIFNVMEYEQVYRLILSNKFPQPEYVLFHPENVHF